MMRRVLLLLVLPLAGCSGDLREIGREPSMSPVGSGLAVDVQPTATASFIPTKAHGNGAVWDGSSNDLFSDPRARKIGDVVTVAISINDKATFGNATARSLENKEIQNYDAKLGVNTTTYEFNPQLNATSTASSNGQGTIDRSEKIQLSIAAVVTDVLPNGNLILSGSQEVRVNFELRLLNVAGIVRPRDISRDNTIAYDKIAEARISYGGRGRVMEVQQPPLVQQVYDRLKPL
jgi:flagellar L-ring protein precursor FlgH